MRHPNVVGYFGLSLSGNAAIVLLEFCGGGSLFEKIHTKKFASMPLEQRMRLGIDIANGVAYLHSLGVIHRDLKSLNVLLDTAGVPKLSDFDSARDTVEEQRADAALRPLEGPLERTVGPATQAKAAGTVQWASPEVLDGNPATAKSDIFSLGVVLWELATCMEPFQGVPPMRAGAFVVGGGRLDLHDTAPQVRDIIESCWRTEPNERPDAAEVGAALEAFCGEGGMCGRISRTSSA